MGIEDRAHSRELADVVVAEWCWNKWELVAYTAAHRGLVSCGRQATA
jgi:hypothetical protein